MGAGALPPPNMSRYSVMESPPHRRLSGFLLSILRDWADRRVLIDKREAQLEDEY